MRSIVAEDSSVGLLLFDEPSASLDPTAEHGMSLRSSSLGDASCSCMLDGRSLHSATTATGQQDYAVFFASIRQPNEARRSHPVRYLDLLPFV